MAVPNFPGVKLTPCCPRCDQPMVQQLAEHRWWCQGCKIGEQIQNLLPKGGEPGK